jgi:hypothetical protein
VAREEKRIEAQPEYRTPAPILRQLARSRMVYKLENV